MQYDKRLQIIAIATSAIVFGAVVIGLVVVGSPAKERAYKRDQQRSNDLSQIENNVITYWQAKKALPTNLDALNDATRGVSVPNDPQTKTPYTYTAVDELHFQLCATFEQEGNVPDYSYRGVDNWNHAAGQTCFDRTIDPAFYGPINGLDLPYPPKPVPAVR